MIGKLFQLQRPDAREPDGVPRGVAPTLSAEIQLESAKALLLANTAAWWVVLGREVDEVFGDGSARKACGSPGGGRVRRTALEPDLPVDSCRK